MKPDSSFKESNKSHKPTIVYTENLAVRHQKIMGIAHNIAEQAVPQIWNSLIREINKYSPEISGDDALSTMTTFLCHFSSAWVILMLSIAKEDIDAGRTKDEILDYFIEGCKTMLFLGDDKNG